MTGKPIIFRLFWPNPQADNFVLQFLITAHHRLSFLSCRKSLGMMVQVSAVLWTVRYVQAQGSFLLFPVSTQVLHGISKHGA